MSDPVPQPNRPTMNLLHPECQGWDDLLSAARRRIRRTPAEPKAGEHALADAIHQLVGGDSKLFAYRLLRLLRKAGFDVVHSGSNVAGSDVQQ